MGYKVLDHTADVAIEVWADSIENLFLEAAKAMFTEIAGSLDDIEQKMQVEIHVSGESLEDLLVGWLSDLLFYFDVAKFIFSRFEVEVSSDARSLSGKAFGEMIDPEKHKLQTHIKAVTYHQMKIEKKDDGNWHTTIVFDV